MKPIDYKFWYIKREDDVHISEAAVRFYEYRKDVVFDERGIKNESIDRFRRLKASDIPGRAVFREINGEDCFIFNSDDFGVISSDDDLRIFLDSFKGTL